MYRAQHSAPATYNSQALNNGADMVYLPMQDKVKAKK